MKKIILTAAILSALTAGSYGQSRTELFISATYNTFSMADLKNEQGEILSDLTSQGIPAKITESYPAYFGFKAGLLIPMRPDNERSIKIGPFLSYTSTGARVHYSDYSGEIKADQIASAVSVGGILAVPIKEFDFVSLRFDFNAMFIFSSFDNDLSVRIGDQSDKQSVSFSASSFALEPALIVFKTMGFFNVGVSAGYLLAFPTDLEADQYTDAYLVDKSQSRVKIEWSGFRIGLMAGVNF